MGLPSRAIVVLALALWPAAASGQERPGWSADAFIPSERGSRWFVLESLDLRGHGRMALGTVATYGYRPVVVEEPDFGRRDTVVEHQARLHTGASFVFVDRFRLGFDVPLQIVNEGRGTVVEGVRHPAALDQVAVGDVRLSGDVRLFGRHRRSPTAAVGLQAFVPSGDPRSFTGDGEPHFRPRFAFSWDRTTFAVAAMAGAHLRGRDEAWARGQIGTEAFAAAAAGAVFAGGRVHVGPELYAATVLSGRAALERRTTAVEALLGFRSQLDNELRIGAGAGLGLARAYGVPALRVLVSLEWAPRDTPVPEPQAAGEPDRDGDGVPDAVDACGFVPGEPSEVPELNGCPPPPPAPAAPVPSALEPPPTAAPPQEPPAPAPAPAPEEPR